MLVFDTDILVDIQRGFPNAVAWFTTLRDPHSVCGFVMMELIQDARNAQEVRDAFRLVAPIPTVWPKPTDYALALEQYAKLHLSDNLGLIDALIAATVVGISGAELCTFNVKHFKKFPGLVTVQPYKKK